MLNSFSANLSILILKIFWGSMSSAPLAVLDTHSKYLFAITKKGTIKEYKKLLYKKQYTHLKVLQLRYSGRDSIIQVRIDLIFIMVPLII